MKIPADLLILDGRDIVFIFKARIIAYVDADTVDIRFLGEGPARYWRARLYDEWLVEDEDDPEEHARVLADQIATLGPVGGFVWVRHFEHARNNERLVARLDKYREGG